MPIFLLFKTNKLDKISGVDMDAAAIYGLYNVKHKPKEDPSTLPTWMERLSLCLNMFFPYFWFSS